MTQLGRRDNCHDIVAILNDQQTISFCLVAKYVKRQLTLFGQIARKLFVFSHVLEAS